MEHTFKSAIQHLHIEKQYIVGPHRESLKLFMMTMAIYCVIVDGSTPLLVFVTETLKG